jgi:ATP-dependent RNA helicase RhlE
VSFNNFSFHPQINAGISKAGFTSPTPIQAKTIPTILSGKDVLGLAQTGTGKTAAFVLPMLQQLMDGPRGKLRGLILSPTRELAEQIHHSIEQLGRETGLRSITVFGGVSVQPQINALKKGVDIVVACPGRLLDLHNQGRINLSRIKVVVIDEADQMFNMGFLPSIRQIVDVLPNQRQTLLFSATMPEAIRSLATEMLHKPETVELAISKPIDTISHAIYPVDQLRKTEMLLNLLQEGDDGQVLVFTRTKHRARKLEVKLSKAGVKATSLQGNLSQNQRKAAMDKFRKGKVKVMVATDIAARGIDVSRVSQVINFDIPDTAEAYTHRTGRTGRMDKLGTALSLVTPDDLQMVRTIERMMGKTLECRKMDGFEVNMNAPTQPKQQQNHNGRPNNQHNRRRSNQNRSRSYAGNR